MTNLNIENTQKFAFSINKWQEESLIGQVSLQTQLREKQLKKRRGGGIKVFIATFFVSRETSISPSKCLLLPSLPSIICLIFFFFS